MAACIPSGIRCMKMNSQESPDYSGNLVHAKAYLHEAEECMRRKDYEKGLMFLKMTDDEVRKAISWVERELYSA